jgi:hypothetical protein
MQDPGPFLAESRRSSNSAIMGRSSAADVESRHWRTPDRRPVQGGVTGRLRGESFLLGMVGRAGLGRTLPPYGRQ